MSYQTGTALHVDDLLGQLNTFLTSNGWTQDKFVAGSGDGHSSEYYWSKGSSFFSFEAYNTTGSQYYHGVLSPDVEDEGIRYFGNTGFNGGAAVGSQPGSSGAFNGGGIQVNFLLPNMTAYHFFTDPTKTYCHVVVETTANEFRHMAFGLCNKLGAYDGGEYTCGHWHEQNPSYVDDPASFTHTLPFIGGGNTFTRRNAFRYNIDGNLWKIAAFENVFQSWVSAWRTDTTGMPISALFGSGNSNSQQIAAPNDYNGLSPFFSLPVGWMVRSSTSWLPAGHFYDVRAVNIENIVPGSTLTLGSDEWLVFPITEKKEPTLRDDLPNTGHLGLAYLKIP